MSTRTILAAWVVVLIGSVSGPAAALAGQDSQDLRGKSVEWLIDHLNQLWGMQLPGDMARYQTMSEERIRKRGCTHLRYCGSVCCRSKGGKPRIQVFYECRNRRGHARFARATFSLVQHRSYGAGIMDEGQTRKHLIRDIKKEIGKRTPESRPDATKHCPHVFWHADEPFRIEKYGYHVLHATKPAEKGLARGLADKDCWAVCYWFRWSGETDYDFKGRDKTPDKEPVVVYVSASGSVVGVQTRVHYAWRDVMSVTENDLVDGKHVLVYFGHEIIGKGVVPQLPIFTHTPILGSEARVRVRKLATSRKAYEMGTDYRRKLEEVAAEDYPF